MVREYLQMVFKNNEGGNFTLTVYDPREDITEEEVSDAMTEILEKGVFISPGGELKSKEAARTVTREVDSIVEF